MIEFLSELLRALVVLVCIMFGLFAGFCVIFAGMEEQRKKIVRRNIAKNKIKTTLAFFAISLMVLFGADKSRFSFTFISPLSGKTDAETKLGLSWASNDVVHVEWTWDENYIGIEGDSVFIACREIGATNEWTQLDNTWLVGDGLAQFEMENATNYNYTIWTEYIPPSPVITNGVYHLSGFQRGQDETNRVISLRVQIKSVDTNGQWHILAPIRDGAETMSEEGVTIDEE